MKFENNNKEVIKRITNRSLKINKVRNIFAILAIVLTTFMISSVFSIGVSFAKNYKTMTLRVQGNTSNVFLNNPREDQINKIKDLNLAKTMGYEINVGGVQLESLNKNRSNIKIKYSDNENFEKQLLPCVSDFKGSYPKEENQILASTKALEFLGKSDAKIGDKIEVPCKINGKVSNIEFVLSGYYTTYDLVQDTGYLLVSKDFVDKNNLTLASSGKLLISLKPEFKGTGPDTLEKEVILEGGQEFDYSYDKDGEISDTVKSTTLIVVIIASFIVLSGYLLIYNVLYIAVTKDINFYGLLKTIGTSPKQIKRIVKGQALKLSAIGIPLGLILGGVVSFGIVPLALGMFFTEATAMPRNVSFNPIIFIAAALFSLITVMLSCKKPAKIAGNISPIEAVRYTGNSSKKYKKNRNSTNGGKLYKMAWYNVFREKKRAVLVFLSLFMGIITFLSVNTFIDSLKVDNFINTYVKNDFELQNIIVAKDIENTENKIHSDMVKKIRDIDGVKEVNEIKYSFLELEMSEEVLLPSLKKGYKGNNRSGMTLDDYLKAAKENPALLSASIVGIDDDLIEKFNKENKEKIDVDNFKEGKLALAAPWYYGDNYKDVKGILNIRNSQKSGVQGFEVKAVEDTAGLLPSGLPAPLGIPTIYVSNSALLKLNSKATNYLLYINVDAKKEDLIKTELKNISSSTGLYLESKTDETQEFKKSQMVMNILGGGISIILILIGALNFINVMITGVNARLKELAVMESIGMTKKQIKKMLTFEGFYYAGITTIFILTLGVTIILGISKLSRQIADYAVFSFPTIPLVSIIIFIFIVCLITPSIVFKASVKKSVTERIRNEN